MWSATLRRPPPQRLQNQSDVAERSCSAELRSLARGWGFGDLQTPMEYVHASCYLPYLKGSLRWLLCVASGTKAQQKLSPVVFAKPGCSKFDHDGIDRLVICAEMRFKFALKYKKCFRTKALLLESHCIN